MQKPQEKRTTWPERFCTAVVWFILAVILTALAVISMFVTCSVYGGNEVIRYGADQPLLHMILIATVVCIGAFLLKKGVNPFLFLRDSKWCLKLLFAAAGICGLWVILTMFRPTSDQRLAFESAQALISGDFSPWTPAGFIYGADTGITGYAFTYPSQNGLILFFAMIAFVFRDVTPYVVQFLNILFLFGGIFFLCRLYREIFDGERMRGTGLLMIAFLPFTFYITFVYGTIPGFACSAAALYYEYCFLNHGGWKNFFISALSICAAILLKSNYLIVLVAMVIYLLTWSLFRKKVKFTMAAVLMMVLYLGSGRVMNLCLETVTGTPVSQGSPMLAWIEMGLQEGSRAPGWYNGYNISVFRKNGLDPEKTKEAVKEDLSETLTEFAQDPKMAGEFFLKKTASLWAEPTFQSLWIQEVKGDSWLMPEFTISLFNENKVLNRVYMAFFDYVQSLVYVGALLFLILRRKSITWIQLLPAVIFIGGFLFHLAWEAKGQYSVCYFILLIPYAVMGLKAAARKLSLFI